MPAQTVEEVKRILHMEVRYDDAINKLGEYRQVIEDITKQMKTLKSQMQSGNRSSSEIKSMNAQYAALDTTLRVVKKDSQELTKTVQNEIKVEREQDNSLRSLRAQLSNLTKAYDSLSAAERNAARGAELKKKINDVTANLKAAEMATQRFYRNVGNYQDALNGINQIKAGFSALGGVVGGLLGGLGLQQLTNNIISVSREFEDAISRVRAVSNATMQDFLSLRDRALELGATTRYTSGEVAQGMEELARKGFTAKQTLDSIKPTLELAQANMVSIADAAQVSSSAVRAFGLETEDLAHTNDILSSVCANSASNLSLLGEAMKTAGPVAKTANVSLEETSALIGSLANVGMTGSDAGTGIKQIILALSSAATTKKGAKVLEHYNIKLDETRIKEEGLLSVLKEMKEKGLGESLTDLQKLTGKYASPRIANLINNIDQAIALNEKLKESLGENERMFEQSLSPLSNSIYQMQSAWQNFMTNMENSSDSVFTKILDSITEIIRFVNKFPGLVMGAFGAIIASVTLTPLVKNLFSAYKEGAEAAKLAAQEVVMAEKDALKEITSARKAADREAEEARNRLAEAEKKLAQQTLQTEETTAQERVRLEQEVQQAQLESVEKGEAARLAAKKQEAQEEKLLNAQRKQAVGLTSKMQSGIKGIGRALGSVIGMLKFQIWIAALTAVVEIIGTVISRIGAVERAIKGVETKIAEVNAGQTDTLKNLNNIKNRIVELQSIKNRDEEQQAELNRLLGIASRHLSGQLKDETDIVKALEAQIEKVKELNRVRLYKDFIGESEKDVFNTGTGRGLEDFTVNGPGDIKGAVLKLANSIVKTNKDMNEVRGILNTLDFGFKDTRVKGAAPLNDKGNPLPNYLRNDAPKVTDSDYLKKSLEDIKNNTSEVLKTKEYKATERTLQKSDFDNNAKGLRKITDIFKRNAPLTSRYGDVADIMEDFVKLNYGYSKITRKQYIGDLQNITPTNIGGYDPVDWGSGKGRKGREFDPLAYLQNLLKKYTTEFNSIVAETTLDVIDKQRKEIDNALKSLQGDVYKIIGGVVDGKKYDPVPQWKRAAAKYPKLAAQVTEMMNKAIEQATVRAQMKIDQLNYQANERTLKIEKTGWDARIALAKAKLQEYFLVTTQNAQQLTERTLEQQQIEFDSSEKNAAIAFNLEKQNKEKELVTSGLVRDSSGNELKTREQVLKAYEAYVDKRKRLEEDASGELGPDEYDVDYALEQLNAQNEALARYYDETKLMEARYEQERLNAKKAFDKQQLETTKKFYDEETRLILQGMQNELVAMQTGYDEQTNANRSYHSKNKIGEQQYWDDIEWMLGERQTKEFQMQYDAAKAEYDRIVEFGRLETETEEDFNARRLAAKKKMVDVETKVNDQIHANQVAVIQSTSEMVGSFGELASAMIDDEKEKAEAMKVFTIMQVMLNFALSMANIVEKASNKGAFGIPEAIAGVAAVTALFASIISTLDSADAEGYATGGKVTGPGTGTSDSIPANLSNGEFVMTAKATKLFEPLLVAMNGIGAGVAIPRNNYVQTQQSADLTDAFSRAAQKITPVVDVREVTRVQDRVKTIQNLGSYKL